MISVIVYGRNDSHGYNLHKRCAISLNCMAELLTADGDEILFVDYNTPDFLPSFLEAIVDTLTTRAKSLIRVLRVRPSLHARFAARTPLPVVEPVARNVGLRRSNPDNRWILSTNADMIFVPRDPANSLSSVAAGSSDGFYHLPRFELPEALWESVDRIRPQDIFASVRKWSTDFHLDDVVFGSEIIKYDAPGDFQLLLRRDALRIDGFDERMILGWHVDSNLAKRMTLLRGQVGTALPSLKGYHCDHTRQATIYHSGDRSENDSRAFVERVTRYDLPAQADNWGLAHEPIEDYRLDEVAKRYVRTVGATIGRPNDRDHYQSHYNSATYDQLDYSVEHMLPYLIDALYCLPTGNAVGYIGCRRDAAEAVARALEALDFASTLMVCDEQPWLDGIHPAATRTTATEMSRRCRIFIVEYGVEPGMGRSSPCASKRLELTINLFNQLVETGFGDSGHDASQRRVIGINVVHNRFESIFNEGVAANLTPFSSRVRHGVIGPQLEITRPQATDLRRLRQDLSRRLGRHFVLPMSELALYREQILAFQARPDSPKLRGRTGSIATALCELLSLEDGRAYCGVEDRAAQALATHIAAASPLTFLRRGLHPIAVTDRVAPPIPGTRIAEVTDWEHGDWLRWARRFFHGTETIDVSRRRPWLWERINALHTVAGLTAGTFQPRILFVCRHAECLAVYFDQLGATVDIVDPNDLFGGRKGGIDWSDKTPDWAGKPLRGLRYVTDPAGEAPRYDFILVPQNALFIRGVAGVGRLMTALTPCLKVGGHMLLHVVLRLDDRRQRTSMPKHILIGGRFAGRLRRHSSFELVGDAAAIPTVSAATVERSWYRNARTEGLPSFVFHGPFSLRTRLQIVLRKVERSAPERWDLIVRDWHPRFWRRWRRRTIGDTNNRESL